MKIQNVSLMLSVLAASLLLSCTGMAADPFSSSAAASRQEESAMLTGQTGDAIKSAKAQAGRGEFEQAQATLKETMEKLPDTPQTAGLVAQVQAAQRDVADAQAKASAKNDAQAKRAAAAQAKADAAAAEPKKTKTELEPASAVSPAFVANQKELEKLALKGRSQYAAADLDGAQETFRYIESVDADNAEAKYFLARISNEKAKVGNLNREKTRAQLMEEVGKAWQRPGLYNERSVVMGGLEADASPVAKKLKSIQVPRVNFTGVELSKVISTLAALTEEYDTATDGEKGVNIVLIDPTAKNPAVTITVRNLPLKRVLDLITESVGYQYEVQADTIVVRPGGETSLMETSYFAVTKATVTRMTGVAPASSTPASSDPFAAPASSSASSGQAGEGEALKNFLQQAGVTFGEGSSLAYDGAGIFVTQTPRNLERIRNILNRYNEVRQVEIEAKFMDVQEGVLEELGVNWGAKSSHTTVKTYNESLYDAFKSSSAGSTGTITTDSRTTEYGNGTTTTIDGKNLTIGAGLPQIPGLASLGAAAGNLLELGNMIIGGFSVDAELRALSQKKGVDLMSAPKVTVISGNPAKLTVAQELRYPQSYGEIQSEVGRGSTSDSSSSAGVTITAGTPQDFTTRNVGVELNVTPTVEEDDYSISLELNPKVTEFEGFVEYGGQSVAISGGTTVTLPSGFFQPVFSTREITTKVTVWDGATLVMGGLTREEVKKMNDKVPVLGDIPFLGRLFQSKGESSSKRNLLVFVTANLVSPGGSPKKQNLKSVQPNTIFQNPTMITPAGAEPRVRVEEK